ncbi:MAG TPA: zf-HC2 domain-containing protein [Gaiellaceae bacterium]|jgi:anti-sigma factor RsiW|nr:zf-HC2 domain-containing protein [Gaiellaceae bacterium]
MKLFRRDMACRELVEVITDYLEGTMPARDRRRLERHLTACDGCTAYLEQMRETISLTGRLREKDVPPELEDRLLAAFRGWKS